MVRRRGVLAAGLSMLLFALGSSSAAAAEPQATISSVTPVDDGLTVQFRGTDLPGDTSLDRDSVQVRLNGREVTASVSTLKENRGEVAARRVALVVDTSGSMSGAPLDAARVAAAAYLAAVPADVEVALIPFANTPHVLVAPTTDRMQVAGALPRLRASGGTSLYDAVLQASKALGPQGQRRMLVLSDGEDSSSGASLDRAALAVRDAGLGLDAVALGQNSSAMAALTKLSGAGRGRLLRAGDGAGAVAAFQEAARAFSAGLQLKVEVPGDVPAGSATLDVEVATSTGVVLHAVSPIVLPDRPRGPGLLSTTTGLVGGVSAVFVGLAAALVLLVSSGDSQAVGRRRTERVLASYTLRGQPTLTSRDASSRIGTGVLARAALALAGRLLAKGERGRRLTTRLDRAAVRFTAREWLVVHAAISIGAFLLALLVSSLLFAAAGAGLTAWAVHVWLSIKGDRRAAAFEAQMPDALQLVASGLSTGYSLPQALDSVVNEGGPPIAEELGRALAEARLGAPLETALDSVADRMNSKDFRWVVMAIRVQRDVGGNLSEVLTTLCQTLRERGALRRQIKALSAEGRLGAVILIALPFLVVAYLSLVNPDFFRPMWETTLGVTLLSGCVVGLAMGALWMKKLIKVEA